MASYKNQSDVSVKIFVSSVCTVCKHCFILVGAKADKSLELYLIQTNK